MENHYNYFRDLMMDWYSGAKSGPEIISETKGTLDIDEFKEQGYQFNIAFDLAIDKFDSDISFDLRMEFHDDTIQHITVDGLVMNIKRLIGNQIANEDFISWASWSNIAGANSSLKIENINIDYFCTIFILKHQELLKSESFVERAIELIRQTNDLPYHQFILYLYNLLPNENKSFYYFFKGYLEGAKSEAELEQYLAKKFYHSFACYQYKLVDFPYLTQLNQMRDKEGHIDDFMVYLDF